MIITVLFHSSLLASLGLEGLFFSNQLFKITDEVNREAIRLLEIRFEKNSFSARAETMATL